MAKLPTQYLELPDIKLAYTEYGSGPNLILLHGNSQSKRIFGDYQTRHFAAFHSYALDSRGHGESVSADDAYSIEQYSLDVIHFCEALGIQEAYVIGYSDGGNIALFLAEKRPDIFTKLVAISPNYLVSGTNDSIKLIRRLYRLFKLLRRLGFNTRKMIMRFELMLTDIGISDDQLRGITTSLRILYAEKDMIKEDHFLAIHDLVPGSTLRKIAHSTHMSIPNKPETIQDIQHYLTSTQAV
ncbi:MAG: alpha/beta hydrolase [Anaerolineae bacterium]|nr:alpha/beta hydrolase [Anaerolineae bacterium]